MDALAGLLDGPRARGAFLLRMVMEPPWAVRVADRAPICLMSVTRG
ncbi:AraC family transcriptional regulator, partial [Streptomyces sp. SID8455]|nr:AraC family transcriptional regulator [Streptomyces sp. SID8455]